MNELLYSSSVKPSILVLADHDDRRILQQANGLVEAGCEVTLAQLHRPLYPPSLRTGVRLISPPSCPEPNQPSRRRWRALISRWPTPIYRAALAIYQTCSACLPGLEDSLAERATHVFPWTGRLPDLIHAHGPTTLPTAFRIRDCLGTRIPVVYDAHELFSEQWSNPLLRMLWRRHEFTWLSQVQTTITVGPLIAEAMATIFRIPLPRVFYNVDGPYTALTQSSDATRRDLLRARPGERVILLQGGLEEGRNLEQVVRAAHLLPSDTCIVVIGDGSLRRKLMTMAGSSLDTRIRFLGHMQQDILRSLTPHADLGLIPYLGDDCLNSSLCLPNKLFEYLAAGVPILAHPLPEISRVLADTAAGRVADLRSPRALAAAIESMRTFRIESFATKPERTEQYSWVAQMNTIREAYAEVGVSLPEPVSATPDPRLHDATATH